MSDIGSNNPLFFFNIGILDWENNVMIIKVVELILFKVFVFRDQDEIMYDFFEIFTRIRLSRLIYYGIPFKFVIYI